MSHFSNDQQQILDATEAFVKEQMADDYTGHDWLHIERVRRLARMIMAEHPHPFDAFVVELAALLHDIGDWKFSGSVDAGSHASTAFLSRFDIDTKVIQHVAGIVGSTSFKGAGVPDCMTTEEGKIVQDADRLDAIGAIGVARVFAYGGATSQPIYDPQIGLEYHTTAQAYMNKVTTSLNHCYEKLLLLKDRMHTPVGKRLAEHRHQVMADFLKQFHADVFMPQDAWVLPAPEVVKEPS